MKIIAKSILFLCLLLMLGSCKRTGVSEENRNVIVNVARATSVELNNRKEFSFIAKPFRSTELSFRVGGPIDRFEVYAGNYYKQGSIIAEIDPRDFHIRKERAEAVYRQAKAEYERIKVLYEKNNISASAFEKAEADCVSAKTAYETSVNELADTKLIAPFDGFVGEVYIEKYQDVKATQPVISFIDLEQLKIEAYVTQDIAFRADGVKTVSLQFDAMPGQSAEARIVEISKSTTPNNLSYLLTALLPNAGGKLPAGLSGNLFLDISTAAVATPAVVIPQLALCHRPIEGDYVWVVDVNTGKVAKRKVIVGDLQPGGCIVVKQGLQPDESVAVSGLRFLSDGMVVKIATAN